jgi:translation initiation factor IF-2
MKENQITKRPPVVAIMGHIDHGKSTLLSYIRKSATALSEAGGITQHISAYEAEHNGEKITFIDTPGHEAFSGHRNRGAKVADIAILVVSAEDGVKPQTLEAMESIKKTETPFIVAITKIDKPEANIDRTKVSLAEAGIYVEGFGGDVSVVPVSGKSGEGVPELLDMILLTAELENLTGDASKPATGQIIESNLDSKTGMSATCIIKDGCLKKGMFVADENAYVPVRVMENWKGQLIPEACFSMPIKITGWNALPKVGSQFRAFNSKKEVEEYISEMKDEPKNQKQGFVAKKDDLKEFPLVVKADTAGSLEAIIAQINKISMERIRPKVVFSGIGTVSENDVRMAKGTELAGIIGFSVKVDSQAKILAERDGIHIHNFDIIYKMSEWLEKELIENTPSIEVEEKTGESKVLKVFSKVKDKQIIGCRMETGKILQNEQVKIFRRDAEIGVGRVRELQSQKSKVSEVEEGKDFGTMIEAKIEIAPGDKLQAFTMVKK